MGFGYNFMELSNWAIAKIWKKMKNPSILANK